MGKAIGIDLGTTNSCAAIVENGKPRVLTYKGGTTTIPSVFAINEKGERLVGHDAKRQAQLNPQNTVAAAKRLIGRNFHSKTIEKVRQVFTYELLEGESNEVLVKIRGGSEAYLAWSDEPLAKGSTVLVIGTRGSRTVDVVAWFGPPTVDTLALD